MLTILKSNEFRQAYHQALSLAAKTPVTQRAAAQKVIERYFRLEETAPRTPLRSGSFYFTERPIEVEGKYKFLVPGTINRELIAGPVFLLKPKAASVERLVEAKEFDAAISAVEAMRLTLMPERVNGIVSVLQDAKKFYAHGDTAGAEKAIGIALEHLNRAAAEAEGLDKRARDLGPDLLAELQASDLVETIIGPGAAAPLSLAANGEFFIVTDGTVDDLPREIVDGGDYLFFSRPEGADSQNEGTTVGDFTLLNSGVFVPESAGAWLSTLAAIGATSWLRRRRRLGILKGTN